MDFKDNCSRLAETFYSMGCNRKFIDEQIGKVVITPRGDLLKERRRGPPNRIAMITTFNRTLPPLSTIINKNGNILLIDRSIKDLFVNKPVISYRRNMNLKDLLEGDTMESNMKVIGKSKTCKEGNLCYKQLKMTSSFKIDKTNWQYDIYHHVNCKSRNVMCLMEYELCPGKQYVGKCETSLNIRIHVFKINSSVHVVRKCCVLIGWFQSWDNFSMCDSTCVCSVLKVVKRIRFSIYRVEEFGINFLRTFCI